MARLGGKYIEKYQETWTLGSSLVVTHNLGSLDVLVVAREIDTGKILTLPQGWGDYDVSVTANSVNSITLNGVAAPTGSGIRVSVVAL